MAGVGGVGWEWVRCAPFIKVSRPFECMLELSLGEIEALSAVIPIAKLGRLKMQTPGSGILNLSTQLATDPIETVARRCCKR